MLTTATDYNTERENNIIKNIAKEISLECIQGGFEVNQELANYAVKLKLLNPRNGFTASEVMPRNLTQQLVMTVVEELKQDTPAMNCIRMQVYWNSVNLNLSDLKKEGITIMTEKAEPLLTELANLEVEDIGKLPRLIATYTLISQNLGNPAYQIVMKETIAAIHSVFKLKDSSQFFVLPDDQKIEKIKTLAPRVTGIRLYLKMSGKAGEGIEDVKNLTNLIEVLKEEISKYSFKISTRIEEVRNVISSIVPIDYYAEEIRMPPEVNLPPDTDINDLKYLKQILAIMLQHSYYLSDITSKLEEIDGNANFYLNEFDETLKRLQATIRDREAVPTSEVYDDFTRAGELWVEIQSYFYCLECVVLITRKLEEINKKQHFIPTALEKLINTMPKTSENNRSTSGATQPSNGLILKDSEDFHLEFRGFCAWTLFLAEGFLIPGNLEEGIYQYQDQYYSFATKLGYEMWSKDPHFCLMQIYETLRLNTELVELLNVYDILYSNKAYRLTRTEDRKISTRNEGAQTIIHPIEKYWDKNYTFSEWELKKRALSLSRLVKCTTKSCQTTLHSHCRSSIGILAAPDKDKEVQTKRDNYTTISTVANYLYGLRGHKQNKFKILTLTRPIDETCEREIIIQKGSPCKDRRDKSSSKRSISSFTCRSSTSTYDKCISVSEDSASDYPYEYNEDQ